MGSITEGLAALVGARHAFAITPHDSNELAYTPRALYIGGAGDVVLIAVDDSDPVTHTVPAGTVLNVYAKIVKATGTTATNIVGWY